MSPKIKNENNNKISNFAFVVIFILFLKELKEPIEIAYEKELNITIPKSDENFTNSQIYGIIGEEIFIRNGPGLEFDKLINEKATEVTRSIKYKSIDFTCKVKEIDNTNG